MAGLAAMAMDTGGCSPESVWSPSMLTSSPESVWSTPPAMVVKPLVPALFAVQELSKVMAVNTSVPDAFTFEMLVDALAVPFGPREPEVLTLSSPELKKVAGSTFTSADGDEALCGLLEALAARPTIGAGPLAFVELKKVTFSK